MREAELAIVDRPAASIGVSQNRPPEVATAPLGAAHSVARFITLCDDAAVLAGEFQRIGANPRGKSKRKKTAMPDLLIRGSHQAKRDTGSCESLVALSQFMTARDFTADLTNKIVLRVAQFGQIKYKRARRSL
jgi:hypothetical protein